jgi:hypothetical protein
MNLWYEFHLIPLINNRDQSIHNYKDLTFPCIHMRGVQKEKLCKVKVKLSHYRPEQAHGDPVG